MSRVLLLVDRGDGPKCMGGNRRLDGSPIRKGWGAGAIAAAMQKLSIIEEVRRGGGGEWFLVEAESADAARAIISGAADYPAHMHSGNDCNCYHNHAAGRILASGGTGGNDGRRG